MHLRGWVGWLVFFLALFLLFAQVLDWDLLEVNGTTVTLLGVLAAVPLLEHVRKIRVGEFEAEIEPREVQAAIAEASADLQEAPIGPAPLDDEGFGFIVGLVEDNPTLGLAQLRMSLETELRQLLPGDTRRSRPMSALRLVHELESANIISSQIGHAIERVLPLANRAIHGETVRREDAISLVNAGVDILESLRRTRLSRGIQPTQVRDIEWKRVLELQGQRYRVITVRPTPANPVENERNLDQFQLTEMLSNYEDYAEFLVRVEPLDDDGI